jgi:hypothetical protein
VGSENDHGIIQNTKNSLGFDILEWYHKDGDEVFNHIIQITADETWVSYVHVGTKDQSKQWMHTHSPNKLKKFKQMLYTCQKGDGKCFLEVEERSTDGGIHATRGHNNVTSILRGMLTSSAMHLHDNECLHTVVHTWALLKHFYWELFDHSSCSPDLAPNNHHLFTCLENWLWSQHFNNTE